MMQVAMRFNDWPIQRELRAGMPIKACEARILKIR